MTIIAGKRHTKHVNEKTAYKTKTKLGNDFPRQSYIKNDVVIAN